MYSALFLTLLNGSLAVPAELPDVDSAAGSSPASIRVYLPKDAKLYFDGEPTHSSSAVREFTTPPLKAGKTYSYEVVGKVVRDGRTVTAREIAELRAGELTEVTLDLPKPPKSPAPATIVVRLPADAQLSIDGEQMSMGGSVRQIESTPLKPGTTFSYTVLGQVVRDGRIITASKEIDVRANEVTQVVFDLPEAPALSAYGNASGYSSVGGSSFVPQGTMGSGAYGRGFAGGGFAGGGFSGGGIPYTSGGGGNTGSGATALKYIPGRGIVPVPLGGQQFNRMGGMPGGFRPGGFGGPMHGGGHGRR